MTTQEINIDITASDVNQVIAENPVVGLQIKIAALSRALEEKERVIKDLTNQLLVAESNSGKQKKKE